MAASALDRVFLIAKLHAYDFSKESLKLIKTYITNRWQRTKLNTGFSMWTDILLGVPQRSVLYLSLA